MMEGKRLKHEKGQWKKKLHRSQLLPCHRKELNEQRWFYGFMNHIVKFSFSNLNRGSLFCLILLLSSLNSGLCQTVSQTTRPFPKLFKAAQYRPILTEPSQGTCGVQERSAYCRSSSYPISVDVCDQSFCVQQCPGRTELPSYLNLLVQTMAFSDCVFLDTINTRPGSAFLSPSTSFISSGPTCFVTPSVTPDLSSTQEFTITLWVWQRQNNNG